MDSGIRAMEKSRDGKLENLRQLFFIFCAIFILILTLCSSLAYAGEIRAVWVHPESLFDGDPGKGRQEVHQFVDRLSDANINLVLPWVRSEYMAALTDERYRKRIPTARWDALGELIKAAHQKGIQTHIWYSFTYYKSPSSPEFDPRHGGDPSWAARQVDELVPDPATGRLKPRGMRNLCPLHPDARKWELNLIETMLARYPLVTGVHIEEPGYSGKGNCVCDLCRQVFRLVYGGDLVSEIQSEKAVQLRCTATTAFMSELHTKIVKKYSSKLILSVNGSWSWRSDRRSGRDWKHWAQLGWLNFYVPQIYTSDMRVFATRARATITDLGRECPVVVGIAAGWGRGKTNTAETIVNQVRTARRLGAKGVVFFDGRAMTDEILRALKAGPFKERVAPF